jgi:hypothetical protein
MHAAPRRIFAKRRKKRRLGHACLRHALYTGNVEFHPAARKRLDGQRLLRPAEEDPDHKPGSEKRQGDHMHMPRPWREGRRLERRANPLGRSRFSAEIAGFELPIRDYSATGLQLACPRARYCALRTLRVGDRTELLLRLFGQAPLRMHARIQYIEQVDDGWLLGLELFPAASCVLVEHWSHYLRALEEPVLRIVD